MTEPQTSNTSTTDAATRASQAGVTAQGDTTPYSDATFKATHNSYSGGSRGTITDQLDAGVRFIELDINDERFAQDGDFEIGHGLPGFQVDHSPGNPESNDMTAWLRLIAEWSLSHPGHAPITVGLDLKNNLARKTSSEGNLCTLNQRVAESLGDLLFTADELAALGGGWPSVSELAGKVLAVISGNEASREGYLSDQGENPAVALNAGGWVVEVHESESRNGLWFWTGRLAEDGSVSWLQHGKYDTGVAPAVAVNDDGVVVEVHKSETFDKLYYHVGQLGSGGEISWGPSHKIGSGELPSVEFASPGSLEVVEIHVDGGNRKMRGTVDPEAGTISWSAPEPTSEPRFATASAEAGGHTVSVHTGTDSAGTPDTLLYSTERLTDGRIRPDQLLFVEFQKGNSQRLADEDLWFYAASAKNLDWGGAERQKGKIVRLWQFTEASTAVEPPVNLPATDTPYEVWYVSYCSEIGTVR